MTIQRIPDRGDVYHLDPESHRYIVITRREINGLGVATTVPVVSGGAFARAKGLTVAIHGYDTTGVAVCNQVRSINLEDSVRQGSARFVESLDEAIMREIINRVVSVIDPA